MTRRVSTVLTALAVTMIAAFALLLRCGSYPDVFTPKGVLYIGHDAYYHLRRVVVGLEQFPSVLGFDRYLHFPDGAVAIWPPYYDQILVVISKLLGIEERSSVEAAAAWFPPLFGVLAVLLTFAAARSVFDSRAVGLAGALVLSVLGAHTHPTQLGFVDHHSIMAVWVAALIWATSACQRGLVRERTPRLASAAVGVVLGGAILVWPGCLALLGVWVAVVALWSIGMRLDAAMRQRVLVGPGVTALATSAVVLAGGVITAPALVEPWALTTLSWLQPAVAFAISVAALGAWLAARTGGRGRALVGALVGGSATMGALILIVPDLSRSAESAVQWLTKDEDFQSRVAESQPLLWVQGAWDFKPLHGDLSWGAWLLPLLGVWILLQAWRRSDGARFCLAIAFICFVLLALMQRRFVDLLAVPAAMLLGWGAVSVGGFGQRGPSVRSRVVRRVMVGILGVTLLIPCVEIPFALVNRALSAWSGDVPDPWVDDIAKRQLRETARWIRDGTPPLSSGGDSKSTPEYGLFALGVFGFCWGVTGYCEST